MSNERIYEIHYRALSMKVLTVAIVNTKTKEFAVYIDSVAGKNHDLEYQDVLDFGSKLSKELAIVLYSWLVDKGYYYRE